MSIQLIHEASPPSNSPLPPPLIMCSQKYLVVNLNLFEPGQDLRTGLLTVGCKWGGGGVSLLSWRHGMEA